MEVANVKLYKRAKSQYEILYNLDYTKKQIFYIVNSTYFNTI
jgi:hypothetical protein